MKWRINESDDHGASGHGTQHGDEVLSLDGQQVLERLGAYIRIVGEDEGLDDLLAIAEEHMLRAAQADGLGAEFKGEFGIFGVIGVDAHVISASGGLIEAHLVRPAENGVKVSGQLGFDQRHRTGDNDALTAVDGDDVALVQHDIGSKDVNLFRGGIDAEALDTAYAWRAHAARDNGSVARLSTMARQDALSGDHALEVIGVRLPAHKDCGAPGFMNGNGVVGGKDNLTHGGSGARVEAARKHVNSGGGVELRMQELVELRGIDAHKRLIAGDEPLLDHVDRDAQRRCGRALARTRLQHPQLALLDSELDVAHIAIMALKDVKDAVKLGRGLLQPGNVCEIGDGLGVADAGDDVLALRVHKEVAIGSPSTAGGVARERDAGRGGLPLVAEYHDLDVDGGTEVVGDAVALTVDASALIHPAAEHGLDGQTKLKAGICGEGDSPVHDELGIRGGIDLSGENLLELNDKIAEIFIGELGIGADPGDQASLGDGVLEQVGIDTQHHVGEHLDEPAIRIPCEVRVVGLGDEAHNGFIVEAEVQHGVHHARHGERRSGADRDE